MDNNTRYTLPMLCKTEIADYPDDSLPINLASNNSGREFHSNSYTTTGRDYVPVENNYSASSSSSCNYSSGNYNEKETSGHYSLSPNIGTNSHSFHSLFPSDEIATLKLQDMLHNILGNVMTGNFVVYSCIENADNVIWKLNFHNGRMVLAVQFTKDVDHVNEKGSERFADCSESLKIASQIDDNLLRNHKGNLETSSRNSTLDQKPYEETNQKHKFSSSEPQTSTKQNTKMSYEYVTQNLFSDEPYSSNKTDVNNRIQQTTGNHESQSSPQNTTNPVKGSNNYGNLSEELNKNIKEEIQNDFYARNFFDRRLDQHPQLLAPFSLNPFPTPNHSFFQAQLLVNASLDNAAIYSRYSMEFSEILSKNKMNEMRNENSKLGYFGDGSDYVNGLPESFTSLMGVDTSHGCGYCDKIFPTYKMMKLHACIHIGKKPYCCINCPKTFSFPMNLKQHENIHEGKKPYVCYQCHKRFSRKRILKYHRNVHSPIKTFFCSKCNLKLKNVTRLKRHKRDHKDCDKLEMDKRKEMRNSKKRKNKNATHYECRKCKTRFLQKIFLRIHKCTKKMRNKIKTKKIKTEKDEPKVKTSTVEEENNLKNKLLSSLYANGKKHSCSVCLKRFYSIEELQAHETGHTEERPFECSSCKRRFRQLYNLQRHERLHSGEKPFACSFCGKAFAREDKVKLHERTHTSGNFFVCDRCLATFTQKHKLKEHIKIYHSEVLPFTCTLCYSTFNLHSEFIAHAQMHQCDNTRKLYECCTCKKQFRDQHNLQRHVRIHSGEKPYECQFCSKRFARSDKLRAHERIHTGERPFCCSACGDGFRTRLELSLHVKQIHAPSTLADPFRDAFPERNLLLQNLSANEKQIFFAEQNAFNIFQ